MELGLEEELGKELEKALGLLFVELLWELERWLEFEM